MKFKLQLVGVSLCFSSLVISHAQNISTVAGTVDQFGYSGDGGPAVLAQFKGPYSLAADNAGNVYIGDWGNHAIRMMNTAGNISTIAGNGIPGYGGDGGPALNARIHVPTGMAVDNFGNIYIADHASHVIRKINSAGIISTIAGNGRPAPFGSSMGEGGLAVTAQLYDPFDVAADNAGNIYIADAASNCIRKINSAGIITTIAGIHFSGGYSGDGGPAASSRLTAPVSVAVDNAGNVYIADLGNHVIRKINTAGIIGTVAGNGTRGYSGDGGMATAASLNRPYEVVTDNAGNIYFAEESNHVIRKVNSAGIISTIAGTGTEGYTGDGGPAINAKLAIPQRITIDPAGNIYVSDLHHFTVRKINTCLSTLNPSVSIAASANPVCAGDPVTFTATPANGGSAPAYLWKINGNSAGANSAIFKTNTLANGDIINCVMSSSVACTSPVSSNNIVMMINPSPVVLLGTDITLSPGNSVQLNPAVTGTIIHYQWTPADGLNNPAILNPVAAPLNTTMYQLKVVADNGCEGLGKITIHIYKKLFMPGAFTPNLDSKNDIFRIPPGTTFDLEDFSIYNRWGTAIFKTKDITKGWDGKYKGLPADAGAYIYVIGLSI